MGELAHQAHNEGKDFKMDDGKNAQVLSDSKLSTATQELATQHPIKYEDQGKNRVDSHPTRHIPLAGLKPTKG